MISNFYIKNLFYYLTISIILIFPNNLISKDVSNSTQKSVATFSIVACDTTTKELGIAVASRFFAVGSVVPWAKAGIGAVATQSFANTSFGWRGLELLKIGLNPKEVLDSLLKTDDHPEKRQIGIVKFNGLSATYTGEECLIWAGGRHGPNYAIQGNILSSEDVITVMEESFLTTKGTLARRIYTALLAGELKGGDSRGKQSAALMIVKSGAGYGGYTDLAIDIRVDDHSEPFKELGRLLDIAEMNYAWNEAWTLFTQDKPKQALPLIESAVRLVPDNAGLLYDLAVIQVAAGNVELAIKALSEAIRLNPKLTKQASVDKDLSKLKNNEKYKLLIEKKAK